MQLTVEVLARFLTKQFVHFKLADEKQATFASRYTSSCWV